MNVKTLIKVLAIVANVITVAIPVIKAACEKD